MIAGWQRTGCPCHPRPRMVRHRRCRGPRRGPGAWWAAVRGGERLGRRRRGGLRASRRLRRVLAHRSRQSSLPASRFSAVRRRADRAAWPYACGPCAACAWSFAGSALIFGDGPIGLLMLALLKAENAASASLRRRARRPAAIWLGEFGAAATLNYHERERSGPGPPPACPARPFRTSSRPADRPRPCRPPGRGRQGKARSSSWAITASCRAASPGTRAAPRTGTDRLQRQRRRAGPEAVGWR